MPFPDTVTLRSNSEERELAFAGTGRLKNVFIDNENTKLTVEKQVFISLISSIKPF